MVLEKPTGHCADTVVKRSPAWCPRLLLSAYCSGERKILGRFFKSYLILLHPPARVCRETLHGIWSQHSSARTKDKFPIHCPWLLNAGKISSCQTYHSWWVAGAIWHEWDWNFWATHLSPCLWQETFAVKGDVEKWDDDQCHFLFNFPLWREYFPPQTGLS